MASNPKQNKLETNPDQGPELFFGLVGAVGSALDLTLEELRKALKAANYETIEIRLSQLMPDLKGFEYLADLRSGPEDERVNAHMDAGNKIRNQLDNGDGVVRVGIGRIRQIRSEHGDPKEPLPRRAYIFNSLKHPEEIKTIRRVYGSSANIISTYEPKKERLGRLAKRLSDSEKGKIPWSISSGEKDEFRKKAAALIDKDEKEIGNPLGQNVRDTFPLADVFVSDPKHTNFSLSLEEQISRYVELLFGARFHTPTVDEYGMFHAHAAALRSADLSRQVGAVITTSDGEIVAAGCNEVPKAGGGSVWAGSASGEHDYRDFKLGQDATAQTKHEIIREVFQALKDSGWIDESLSGRDAQQLTIDALYGSGEGSSRIPSLLKDTRIASILEFGRIVHAEMAAITDAARRGLPVKGATLYCTTFPCHMCARHILASGIKRVVYIEPYPKSLAKELYEKSIRVDGDSEADTDAVKFEPFVGVAPRRYFDLFSMLQRKTAHGTAYDETHIDAVPRLESEFPVYPDLETVYTESVQDAGLGK